MSHARRVPLHLPRERGASRPPQGITRIVLLVVISLLLVFACGPANERTELSQAARDAVTDTGDGGTVDMREVAPFEWDRMFAFGPYTPNEEVTEVMGVEWQDGDGFRLSDDWLVLVTFVRGQDVVGWDVFNGDRAEPLVEFAEELYGLPIDRDDAVFRARRSIWSDGDLEVYTLGPSPAP